MPQLQKDLLTEREVCGYADWQLPISHNTLRRSRCTGKLLGYPAPEFLKLGNYAKSPVRYRRSVIVEWRNRFLLSYRHTPKGVRIPFAEDLADKVPPIANRLRRDFKAVLMLIRAHALIHKANRTRDKSGKVIAAPADYRSVRDLVADIVAEGVEAIVPVTVREAVDAVSTLDVPEGVTAKDVGDELGIDRTAAYRRLQKGVDLGYLKNLEDRRGRPGRYVTVAQSGNTLRIGTPLISG